MIKKLKLKTISQDPRRGLDTSTIIVGHGALQIPQCCVVLRRRCCTNYAGYPMGDELRVVGLIAFIALAFGVWLGFNDLPKSSRRRTYLVAIGVVLIILSVALKN